MQISFCPLFSGSSGNALLVVCEGTALLVDAGVSASRVMKECAAAGVDPARLAGILITHEHSDHISGAGILSRKLDLPIYAPEKTWEAMAGKIGDVAAPPTTPPTRWATPSPPATASSPYSRT